jgi:ELWxxDGT repeat protein
MGAVQWECGRQSNRHVVEALEGRWLLSVSLVADINQIPTSTTALGQLTDNNGTLFFADNDGYSGTELWKSDGTAAGTTLVKDINPGSASSTPTGLTSINGEVYFAATDTTGIAGLWKSDGTIAGTKKISSGTAYLASPNSFVSFNGEIYFLASDNNSTTGGSLWETNGTTATEIKNVYDSNGNTPNSLTVFNGALYFFNGGTTAGGELIQSNGTASGTNVVKTFTGTHPLANLTLASSAMFFTFGGDQLWTSNGTAAGTVLVATIGTSSTSISDLTALGSSVYFSGNDGSTGMELWGSNGTSASEVKDIYSGSANSSPAFLTVLNSKLYFSATDTTNTAELWTSDGTNANTTKVASLGASSHIYGMTLLGSMLFFNAKVGSYYSLWTSDGTTAGTSSIYTFSSTASNASGAILTSGTHVYFPATTPTSGTELWESTGTTASTQLLKDIYVGSNSSQPYFFTVLNGKMLFTANDGINGATSYGSGVNLWSTDGTTAGTSLIFNFNADGTRRLYSYLTTVNGYAYLSVTHTGATYSNELWRTDGTSGGTVMLGAWQYDPGSVTLVNGNVLFIVSNGVTYSLYKTDGTSSGTVLIANTAMSSITATLNGIGYGTGTDSNGSELWRTDGTAAGTHIVADLNVGANSSNPMALAVLNNKLLFMGISSSSTNGEYNTLYSSDGTAAGTVVLATVPNTIYPYSLVVGSNYFFNAGSQLWVSNGTASGTHLVVTLGTGSNGADPANFANLNGVLLFVAYDSGSSFSAPLLCRSDGTAAGTYPVTTVLPENVSYPAENAWTITGGLCYFAAYYPQLIGIYRTDGTAGGTYLVESVVPGLNGSYISYGALGNQLLFSGDDQVTGAELWQYTPDATPLVVQTVSETQGTNTRVFTFTFNRPASGFAGPESLTLSNITALGSFTATYQIVTGGSLIATYQGLTALTNGNYQVLLPAGSVSDANGNPLSAPFSAPGFFQLAGDANGDRHVDAADVAIVNADMGLTNATWAQGDFNGDGVVNAADLAIVNANLSIWLPQVGEDTIPISTGNNTVVLRSLGSGAASAEYIDVYEGSPMPSVPTYLAYVGLPMVFDLNGGTGNTSLTLDFSSGFVLPSMNFNGGTGTNTLTFIGSTGTNTVSFSPGMAVFNTSSVAYTGAVNLVYDPGSQAQFSSNDTVSITGVKVSLPAVAVGAQIVDRYINTLSINTGGRLVVPATYNTNGTLDRSDRFALIFNSLSVTGVLDLGDADAIGPTLSLPAVTSLVQAGYAHGTWNGATGIITSVAAQDSTHLSGIGVIQNINATGTPLYFEFDREYGESSSAILIKYTYQGDANLSGKVDGSDYSLIDNGYLTKATGWSNGDFNYDGVIDGSDYTLIDNAFNTQGAAVPSAQLAYRAAAHANLATPVTYFASNSFSYTDSNDANHRRNRRVSFSQSAITLVQNE